MAILNYAKYHLARGEIALNTATIKAMLLTSSHATNIDTQHYVSDINSNEVSGTNYTAGGIEVTGKSVTLDTANDCAVFTAGNVTFANITASSVRYLALYADGGSPSSSILLCIIDLGKTYNLTSVDFTIEWNSNGIIKIT